MIYAVTVPFALGSLASPSAQSPIELVRRQQDPPHTQRPPGHMAAWPLAQLTLQLPTLVHVTEQRPSQVTSQLPTLVHSAVPRSPSTGAQSLTFWQVYVQPAPHWAWHVLVLEQLTLQFVPQVTEQLVPPWQR
jgi:hypothetical protein